MDAKPQLTILRRSFILSVLRRLIALIVVAGLGSTLWRGAVGQDRTGTNLPALQAAETAIPPVVDPEVVSNAKSLSRAFRAVAKAVQPTVVKITTSTKPQRAGSSRNPRT